MLAAGTLACATSKHNYSSPQGPRYSAGFPAGVVAPARHDTLRVASFNIQFAIHVDSAIALIRNDSTLRDADILLLQEMDEAGTQRIAQALGMSYVYYPSTLHPKTHRDFGNAVLSRYPIIADAKILLPHISRFRHTQRTATAALVQMGDVAVRVYSTHLGTVADVSAASRRDQMRAILQDAAQYQHVIIGGDLNNKSVGDVARAAGYAWPTQNGPHTVHLFRWDHIFLRGLIVPARNASGTIINNHHASDHRPIWVRAILP